MDCLFCQIVSGTIPARKVFEDSDVIAFHDVHPQAPVHILVIPKQHFASLEKGTATEQLLLGRLLLAAVQVARSEKLEKGYRVVVNTGPDGGQTVDHLHLHLLGGRSFSWPPG